MVRVTLTHTNLKRENDEMVTPIVLNGVEVGSIDMDKFLDARKEGECRVIRQFLATPFFVGEGKIHLFYHIFAGLVESTSSKVGG